VLPGSPLALHASGGRWYLAPVSDRRSTLFGRAREVRTLLSGLDGAREGRGGVALIAGEPGIGKTRLLEELEALGGERGFLVAWGRGWELGSAPTYWPWIEVLRTVLARRSSKGAATEVVRLLPEVSLGAKRSGSDAQGPSDPFEVGDAVSQYLREAAVETPLLVLLDDLHAADPSSLELAEFVARQVRDCRIYLVGSHRDVEARLTPEVDRSLSRFGRLGDVVALRRLDIEDVEALAREEAGRIDEESARMIHSATEGNPLFVRELLRLISARGSASGGVPAGVRAVLRERLALLPPATVALLQAAAVVGREFSIAVAANVAGVTAAALEEAVVEARRADLLGEARPGHLRFSHALVAETLAADLAPPVRAKLHRAAAEELEKLHADDPSAPLGEIAQHWFEAGAEAFERALDSACLAASVASRRMAFADASALYERALQCLAASAPGDAARRAQLLVLQVEALSQCGDRTRAESLCTTVCDLARSLGDSELFARAALALGAEGSIGRADPVVMNLLEEALALLPPGDEAYRAKVMARLASARQPALDPSGPVALAREAIAMARRLGDPSLVLPVVHAAMGALMDFAPAEERAALNDEVARLASVSSDRPRELRARMRLAFDRIELGDLDGFAHAVATYEAVANRTPQPRHQWVGPMFRSMRANWEGRFEDADRLEAEARRIWESAKIQGPPMTPGRGLAVAFLREDPEGIEQGLSAYLRAYPEQTQLEPIFRAYLQAWKGERVEMSSAFAKHSPDGGLGPVLANARILEFVTEAVCATADVDLAALVYAELLRHAGKPLMVTGIGFCLHSVTDLGLLRLASVLRKFDDADRHARAAIEYCEGLGARPIAMKVRYYWAESLAFRRDEAALSRARELLSQARETAEDLGIGWRVERCRMLAQRIEELGPAAVAKREVSASMPSSNQEPDSSVQLVHEGEYWTLSGFGEVCRIRDGRGMRMLAELVRQPQREVHVLELSGSSEPVDGGDAGEAIDREARDAYAKRLRDLSEEMAEAEEWNDTGRRERLANEIAQLEQELARSTGLGGRERRVGSAVERARVNVRRRLSLVMQRIEETAPALGKHIASSVRTGTYCVYDPD
jgi:hypothetical protein